MRKQLFRVTGVIEVYVRAETPKAARDLAEARLYRVLDRDAKSLDASLGLDNVTKPLDQENLLP